MGFNVLMVAAFLEKKSLLYMSPPRRDAALNRQRGGFELLLIGAFICKIN